MEIFPFFPLLPWDSPFSLKSWSTRNEGTNLYLATRWHCWWRPGRDRGGGEIESNLFRDWIFFFFFFRVCFKKKKCGGGEEGKKEILLVTAFSLSTTEGRRRKESFRQPLVTTTQTTVGCGDGAFYGAVWHPTKRAMKDKFNNPQPQGRKAERGSRRPQATVCWCWSWEMHHLGQSHGRPRTGQ